MTDNIVRVTATVTSPTDDTGTDWLQLRGQHSFFDISVAADGSFSGTVHLQRRRPGEAASAARDVESYAGSTEKLGEMQGHWDVRLFVKSGNIATGSVALELGR